MGHTLRGCVDWNQTWGQSRTITGVTPFVGVWIETLLSRPHTRCMRVTPFVGVWIETENTARLYDNVLSHPSWVCGLKPLVRSARPSHIESHPSWVCGLKLENVGVTKTAWGHTLRGCVDWNLWCCHEKFSAEGHTLRGCVDWNQAFAANFAALSSHTLRGCVDWNRAPSCLGRTFCVTPFVGVWIETFLPEPIMELIRSHPSWVCGLKLPAHNKLCHSGVTPFVGVWIETSRFSKITVAS